MAMTERNPFEDPRKRLERTKVNLRGPNVTSTFDTPPRPDALRVLKAAVRKHLHERRPGDGQSSASEAPPSRGAQVEKGSSTSSAVAPCSPTASVSPGEASRRTSARAIVPSRGDSTTLPKWPMGRSPSRSSWPGASGPESSKAARAGGGWACPGSTTAPPSPARRSSPS